MSKEELIQFEGLVIEILARRALSRSARCRLRGPGLHGGQDEEEPDQTLVGDRVTIALRSSEGPPDLPS